MKNKYIHVLTHVQFKEIKKEENLSLYATDHLYFGLC